MLNPIVQKSSNKKQIDEILQPERDFAVNHRTDSIASGNALKTLK
jgi:hypothetical protein